MLHQHATGGRTWNLPKIRGHAIEVSPFFLLIIGLFVFMGLHDISQFFHQLMWAPVLFFSVLLHELGHAAATKRCGFGTSRIVLHGLGGVAISRRGHTTPKQGMTIALAGPAVTAILAIVFGALFFGYEATLATEGPRSVLGFFLLLMALANVFWLVFNLLPIYPMDGGQTLMHFLRRKGSQRTTMEKTLKVSLVTIAIAGVLTLIFLRGGIFILLIFAFLAYSNYKTLQQIQQGASFQM